MYHSVPGRSLPYYVIVCFLVGVFSLKAQRSASKQDLNQLFDSLHQKLLNFNYYDSLSNDDSFFTFEQDILHWRNKALEAENDSAYHRAQHLRFLFYKYNGLRYRAAELLDSLLANARESGQTSYTARYTYLKGTEHSRHDELDSALLYFEKALETADSIDNYRIKSAAINAMAVTYAKLLQPERALNYYKEAFDLAVQAGDSSNMLMINGNIGLTYAKLEQGDSAKQYAQKGLGLARERNDIIAERQALNVMVMSSFLQGDYEEAIAYADEIEDLIQASGDIGYLITPYLYRSKSNHALGELGKAKEDASLSLEYAENVGFMEGRLNAMEWQIALQREEGDFAGALKNFEQLAHLKDSMAEVATNRRIDRMAMNYEIRERENQIASLEQLNEINDRKLLHRNLAILAILILFVTLVTLLVIWYKKRLEREQMQSQKAKDQLLRSQMNPHFLFNALSSIQLFLINKGQGKEALEYLSKFAKLMRRILENSRESVVSLEDEVTTLRHYLDLQKIRFDHKFDYTIELTTENDPADIMIPPMFAQPFIENSLEHGIAHRDDGVINLWFKESGGMLNFRVEDNGIGITRSAKMKQEKEHQSLATLITRDRISLLNKQLKKRISFDVRDKRDDQEKVTGTEVVFELPIVYRFT